MTSKDGENTEELDDKGEVSGEKEGGPG